MMTTTAEKLMATAQALPEPLLAEALDFAEFLRSKQEEKSSDSPERDLLDLCGGMEESAAFHEAPEIIQRQLRDEWH